MQMQGPGIEHSTNQSVSEPISFLALPFPPMPAMPVMNRYHKLLMECRRGGGGGEVEPGEPLIPLIHPHLYIHQLMQTFPLLQGPCTAFPVPPISPALEADEGLQFL